MKSYLHRLLPLLVLSTPLSAMAAIVFNDNFTNGISSNWANPTDATFTDGVTEDEDHVNFNGVGDGGRAFLRTVDTDYSDVDFTASVDLMRQGSGGQGTAFFGIGPGAQGAFGEPSTAPVIYMRLFGESFTPNFADVQVTAGGSVIEGSDGAAYTNSTIPNDTYVRFTLTYVANTKTATFSWDTGLGLESVSASNVNLSPSSSRIFFGGNAGVQADNFTVNVVPEPSVALLGGFGLLGLLRRRRS